MKEINDAKEIFDKIEVPKELDQAVTKLIKEHPEKKSDLPMYSRKRGAMIFRRTMAAAAGLILCFTVALNSSETFAKSIEDLPVIGAVAKVLTIRSYQTTEDNVDLTVKVPEIRTEEEQNNQPSSEDPEVKQKDTDRFVADVNAEINKIEDAYLEDAGIRMQADKDAFIATGGTEEEWAKKNLDVNVDYEVKYQKEDLLSLVLTADESWYGAYDLRYFYNLDLKNNKKLSLKDVLGENYEAIANECIIRQMKDKAAQDPNMIYWGVTDNDASGIKGFVTVNDATKFYINKEGKPVVYFEKYEVAPGAYGAQEFVID